MENSSLSATSPDYRTPWKADSFRFWPSIGVAIGLILLFLIISLILVTIYAVTKCNPVDPAIRGCLTRVLMSVDGIQFQLIVQTVLEALACVALVALLPWLSKLTLPQLGFKPLTWRVVGIALLGALAMVVFVNGLGTLMQAVTKTHEQQFALKVLQQLSSPGGRALAFLTAAVVAPVFEELSFRVFVFNFVLSRSTFWPAAIVSAILFGLAHITGALTLGSLSTIIPLMLGGVILARVYYSTGNAYASMITHAVFNSVSLLGLFFAPNLVK